MSTFGVVAGRPSRCRLVALMSVLAMVSPVQAAMASAADAPKAAPAAGGTAPDKGRAVAAEQSRSAFAARELGLGRGEKLTVRDVMTDPDGSSHVRYDRTFNGLRVIGGDFVSHRDQTGAVKDVSWNVSGKVAVASTTAKVTLAVARATGARKAASVQKTTAASEGEKIVYAGGATPKLAYDILTVGVRADQIPSRLHTIIDASTGATLTSFDDIQTGSGKSIYAGTVAIGTVKLGNQYMMRDLVGNHTMDLRGAEDTDYAHPVGTPFYDADNTWGNWATSDPASVATDVQYGVGKSYEYFQKVQGRNGIWGNGVGVRSRVHFGVGVANAYWNGYSGDLAFGDGDGFGPIASVDVAAHEMTHGVTQNSARLAYSGESGGLNEATSDIFGTAVEWYAKNPSVPADYLIGKEVNIRGNGTPLRYMDRPSRDLRSADCWSPTMVARYDDEVHWTSGPLNHWFFLASVGSGAKTINGVPYNSPTCNGSTVTPVGQDVAAKIWYRALTMYLTSNSSYADARNGAIRAAKDIHGSRTAQCNNVAAAFSAIGVPLTPGGQTCTVNPFRMNDFNRDGHTDLVARDKAGTLWLYPGNGAGKFLARKSLGAGWNRYTTIVSAGDLTGDGNADILARMPSGQLLLYPGNGAGRFAAMRSMGLGWNGMNAISGAGEMTGDGRADVLARDRAGKIWLYPMVGAGTFGPRRLVAPSGWNTMNAIRGAGDLSGNRLADVLARDSSGRLWTYHGSGNGLLRGRTPNGAGWNGMTALVTPGNWDSVGGNDLIARDRAGMLWLYPGNGAGKFAARRPLGGGFKTFTVA